MNARYTHAHIFSRFDGSRFLAAVTDRDITAEYDRLSAVRNDRLDESERDVTLAEVIDWLERAVDDGALRRYVPIETARVTGIRAIGYGREVRYSAADVRDVLGESEHGECADFREGAQ